MQKPTPATNGRTGRPSRCATCARSTASHRRGRHQLRAARRHHHGAARRQRRRQDHHHLDADGAGHADLRQARVLGADMARERHKVLHRMNFESPYVDMPMRLTVRQNLEVFGRLYGVRDIKGRIDRQSQRTSGSPRCSIVPTASCRPARRRASASPRRCSTSPSCCCSTSRPPRSTRTPPTGSAASSRPIARSPRRHHRARLPQHGGGGAARRPRHHAGEGRIIADETPARR